MQRTPSVEPEAPAVANSRVASAEARLTGYRVGDLVVHLGRAAVTRDAVDIPLGKLSFDLLVALARAAPDLLTLDAIMQQVWPGLVVGPETVSQRVKLLRTALGEDAIEPRYVAGVRGRGYRLIADVAELREAAPSASASPTAPAPTERRRGRRSAVLALSVIALLAVALIVWRAFVQAPATVEHRPSSAALPPRSIAVLPFEDLGDRPGGEVLALGIPEAVLHQLASLEQLQVIARTSSFAFRNRDVDVRQIGRQLNARYLLEGSVQRDHEQLRVTAQLVDAESGGHVWSMQFDRKPLGVFELQDEIALEVARALKISLDAAATRELKGQGTTNFDAYLEYLQGSSLLTTWRVVDMKAAAEHAARAMAIDPKFAPAYVLRATALLRVAEFEASGNRRTAFGKALAEARGLVDRALTLDPGYADGYVERAYINAFSDLSAAEFDYRKGLDLSPNDATAYEGLAAVLYENPARRDEALALLDRARKLDPLEPRLDVIKATFLHYGRSNLEESASLALSALRRDPLYQPALLRLAEIRWSVGHVAEAVKLTEQALAADPAASHPRLLLQQLYLDLGDRRAAESIKALRDQPLPTLQVALAMHRRDWKAAGEAVYRAATDGTIAPVGEPLMIGAVRMHARATGDYMRAIQLLEQRSQTVWDESGEPIIRDPSTLYCNVVGLADMLILAGQGDRGRRLAEAIIKTMDREANQFGTGELWHMNLRPVALALLGRSDAAIEALRRSTTGGIDVGSHGWWFKIESDPALDSLRGDPRFQAIATAIRERAAAERRTLDGMRANGLVPDRAVVRDGR